MKDRKRMDRVGRLADMLAFMHRAVMTGETGVTVGEYARASGLSRSPYLGQQFEALVKEGLVLKKMIGYRATFCYEYAPNYPVIENERPEIKNLLLKSTGAWQESLL